MSKICTKFVPLFHHRRKNLSERKLISSAVRGPTSRSLESLARYQIQADVTTGDNPQQRSVNVQLT